MRRVVVAALAASILTGGGVLAPAHARSRFDIATVQGHAATLDNGRVRRVWHVTEGPRGGIATTSLVDVVTGQSWAGPQAATDFHLTLDGVPLSSTGVWTVRTYARGGDTIEFRLTNPAIEIVRSYTLRAGSGVITVASTVRNPTPVPLRIGAYTLDEVAGVAGRAPTVEVQTYHGGSDWRDDYRVMSRPSGSFDIEGEVIRVGDRNGAGVFLVSERRSGIMSRVGRDVGSHRVYAGVDVARDLLDAGPLLSNPPDYNRVTNPAYPVPVRQRSVLPLATLALGRVHTGVYHGGAEQAAATFVNHWVADVAPPFARTVGLNSFHPWSHGAEFNATTMMAQTRAGLALGLETVMLDDQWQGGAGGESGDWHFDPVRFPDHNHDGTPDFVDDLHALGLRLALWMSPVEFNMASTTYAEHPDWACLPTGDVTAQVQDDAGLGVWDVTKPAVQDYLTGVIDRAVAQWRVVEFKFDFQTWVDCVPHDYFDYEDAFVTLVRRFEARHPTVTFELDETNDQRAWPFESAALGPSWFDNGHLHGSGAVPKLLHDIWSAAPWLPPSSIGMGLYDGTLKAPYSPATLMPLALLSHVTFWSDITKLAPADATETAWWTDWYKTHRADLSGLVYDLTDTDPIDGRSWVAFEPWAGDHGELFAFRQAGGPATLTVAMHGVDPTRTYQLTDVRSGAATGMYSGAELAAGIPISLAPFAARVIAVTPI